MTRAVPWWRPPLAQLYVLSLGVGAVAAAVFVRERLPAQFLLDDGHIQNVIASTGSDDAQGFTNIAALYRFLGLGGHAQAAAMLGVGLFAVTAALAVRWEEASRLTLPGLAIVTLCFLFAELYLACYSKEIVSAAVVLIALAAPAGAAGEAALVAAMLADAEWMRQYWALIAAAYVLWRIVLPRMPSRRLIGAGLLACFAAWQLAFTAFLGENLTYFRASVNATRAGINTAVGSVIVDVLPANGAWGVLDGAAMCLSLMAPWPLLLGSSATYLASSMVLLVLWGSFWRALGARRGLLGGRLRARRAAALLLAAVSVQAIFEPDYGSYLKHLTPLLPLFLTLLPLLPEETVRPLAVRLRRSSAGRGIRLTPHSPVSVLHVTDAAASGVLSAVTAIAAAQAGDPRFGRIAFAYVPRRDSPTPAQIRRMTGPGVHVEQWSDRLGRRRLAALAAGVLRAARAREFTVLHLHSSRAGLLGRWAARRGGFRGLAVYSPHAFAFGYRGIGRLRRLVLRGLELCALPAGRALILASESEQRLAVRALPGVRTAVLRNAVDVATLQLDGWAPDRSAPPQLVHIGRLAPAKAPALFTATARLVGERMPAARFVWLGDGDRSLLGDAPVEVSGWLEPEALRARLRAASVVLFTSNGEGMPMALLEAQAMGVPVVASRVIGVVDIVDDTVTGYLGDTAEELAAHVLRILGSPAEAARLSRAAQERAWLFDTSTLAEASWRGYARLAGSADLPRRPDIPGRGA